MLDRNPGGFNQEDHEKHHRKAYQENNQKASVAYKKPGSSVVIQEEIDLECESYSKNINNCHNKRKNSSFPGRFNRMEPVWIAE